MKNRIEQAGRDKPYAVVLFFLLLGVYGSKVKDLQDTLRNTMGHDTAHDGFGIACRSSCLTSET